MHENTHWRLLVYVACYLIVVVQVTILGQIDEIELKINHVYLISGPDELMTVTSAKMQFELDGFIGVTSNIVGVTARVTGVTGRQEDGDRS